MLAFRSSERVSLVGLRRRSLPRGYVLLLGWLLSQPVTIGGCKHPRALPPSADPLRECSTVFRRRRSSG